MNWKTSESHAACRTWLAEGALLGLEVTFETDLFPCDFRVDVCCPRTAPEYQYDHFLQDIQPLEGSPGSKMVKQKLVLRQNCNLLRNFREQMRARSSRCGLVKAERR